MNNQYISESCFSHRERYGNEKWNESGFRPPLCTYRLNWARRTSWGWWDDWDDTVLQTQDSKFEPWRSEAEHATSRSRRLPTILTFTRGWGRNIFVSFKPPRPGTEPRTLAWKAAVLTTTLGPPPAKGTDTSFQWSRSAECSTGQNCGRQQAWGQSTRYSGTLVLEYRFCSTRRYWVLVFLKSTCTQVLLKIKVLLTSTYEYFMSTNHLKLIENSSQKNHKSL